MSEFEGKVALVTGAGRGIGRAIAEALAAQGARVAANDLTPINLDVTVRRISASGGVARDYVFDVAMKMPVQAMIERILDEWGRIDLLINNAGVEPHDSLLDMDEWDWRRTVDVNLTGPFFTIQSVGRVMRQQGGGCIVNIASAPGWTPGMPPRPAFFASKMGLVGLTQEAARELAAHNIRVNAVCPGLIETERTAEWLTDADMRERWRQAIPSGRAGRSQDVVDVTLFLCSAAASYLTGQSIPVDGGWLMK
jgi:3-oxoacyl-[acyl-carrier protein] reductase